MKTVIETIEIFYEKKKPEIKSYCTHTNKQHTWEAFYLNQFVAPTFFFKYFEKIFQIKIESAFDKFILNVNQKSAFISKIITRLKMKEKEKWKRETL